MPHLKDIAPPVFPLMFGCTTFDAPINVSDSKNKLLPTYFGHYLYPLRIPILFSVLTSTLSLVLVKLFIKNILLYWGLVSISSLSTLTFMLLSKTSSCFSDQAVVIWCVHWTDCVLRGLLLFCSPLLWNILLTPQIFLVLLLSLFGFR